MTLLRAVLPSVVLLLMVLLAVFPWGVAIETRFFLPLLPALAILAMNLRRQNAVPEWMAFAAGLLLDALSAEPLGFWALVYLAACALAAMLQPHRGSGIASGWAAGAASLAAIAVVQWCAMSAYALSPVAWEPLLRAAALAALMFPLFDAMLQPFAARPQLRDNGYLVRGG